MDSRAIKKRRRHGISSIPVLSYPATGTMFFSVRIKKPGGKRSMLAQTGTASYAAHQSVQDTLAQIISDLPDGRMSVNRLTEITVIAWMPVDIPVTPAIE